MVLVGVASYCASKQKNPITGRTQAIALNPDQEVQLGFKSAPRMAAQFGGEDPNPVLQAQVRSVGERIVSRSPASKTPYKFQFTLLKDGDTVNAFALPGGPIFITRGLMKRLSNEAQLAGVLGHEVGHVVGRHAAERIAKSELGRTIVAAVGVAASDDRRGSAMARMAGEVAVKVVQLKYGREDELQSDTLGVQFMSDAGYDPRGLIDVMKVLADVSGNRRRSEFMSSHPDPGNRSEAIKQEIAKKYPNGVPTELTTGGKIDLGMTETASEETPRRARRP
jgi:predicted Zn-dependent protease